jgi:hypothetical protein
MIQASEAGPRGDVPDAVPRWAKWFVGLFLTVFAVCSVVGIEAWPLTGWRLFSHVRTERQTTWQAVTVDALGREQWLPLSRFPGGLNGFVLVMPKFSHLSLIRRAAMCQAWTAAARSAGRTGTVRIYEVDRDLAPRDGSRPARSPTRTLRYTCRGGSVEAAHADGHR